MAEGAPYREMEREFVVEWEFKRDVMKALLWTPPMKTNSVQHVDENEFFREYH